MITAVLGGASGGFDELVAVSHMAPIAALFAVNDAGAEYTGRVDYFVTLHPEKLPLWIERRRQLGLSGFGAVVAHKEAPGVTDVAEYRWPGMIASGSSGLFAAKIALERTSLPVVLCGVPMDPVRTHYTESTFRNDHAAFMDAWRVALPHLRERVRSMSGWTSDLLGKPTPEWLAGCRPQQREAENGVAL